MTAIEFFKANQRDGRALLHGNSERFFVTFKGGVGRHAGPAHDYRPDTWLIRHLGVLLLCADTLEPVKRIVLDNEPITGYMEAADHSDEEWTTGPIHSAAATIN